MTNGWLKLCGSEDAELLCLDEKKTLSPTHLRSREIRDLLSTRGPIGDAWQDVHIYSEFEDRRKNSYDVARCLFSWDCAVSAHFMNHLSEPLNGYVEWLPLIHRDGKEFFIPHPLLMLDVLNKEQSKITYVPGYPAEPMYVTSVHLETMKNSPELADVPMFCTPETAGREAYISPQIAQHIVDCGLTGADLRTVHSSS